MEIILKQTLQREISLKPETRNQLRFVLLRDKTNERFTPRGWNNIIFEKKIINGRKKLITNGMPKILIKYDIKTVGTGGLTDR